MYKATVYMLATRIPPVARTRWSFFFYFTLDLFQYAACFLSSERPKLEMPIIGTGFVSHSFFSNTSLFLDAYTSLNAVTSVLSLDHVCYENIFEYSKFQNIFNVSAA